MKRPASTRHSNSSSRRRLLLLLLLLLPALPALLSRSNSAAEPPRSQPLHTNQPKFRIPFEYDPEEMARLRAVEIQLYTSTNQGRDWEHAQSVAPAEAKFTFEASDDGEHWFAVRTLDAGNQRHPGGPLQPGLRVVIDRSLPELLIGLRESAAGEIELTWRAEDEHLDVDSISLKFLDPSSTEWQNVAISAASVGRTTWTVPRTGRVIVRGSVSDRAGNVRSAEASVDLGVGGARRTPSAPATPDFNEPVAENPGTGELANRTEPSTRRSSLALPETPLIQPLPLDRDDYPQIVSVPSRTNDPAPLSVAATTLPEHLLQGSGRETLRVNSSLFNLNYQFDEVGPSGVGEVDLFITEDGGQKWFLYGQDEDRESPFQVEVPEDGTYGFALRVRSGVGLVADPPQPGQSPEMTLVVDRQPPQVELLPIRQEMGATQAQVRIQWQVSDEELAERPVALYYASRPTGPWQPITGWSENSGEYTWRIERGVPESMYIRLEARDAAGNLARIDSETPLVIDLTRPTARLLDVEMIQPE